MPHGDFSDYAAYFCLGTGVASLWNPRAVYTTTLGPVAGFEVKPLFAGEGTGELDSAVQFVGVRMRVALWRHIGLFTSLCTHHVQHVV